MINYATFAGGCFWCTEKAFSERPGILLVVSGYTGGTIENPTYEQVCSGQSGHVEAVQITYDDQLISYDTLLTIYWRSIDPTDGNGQFYDRGHQYAPIIFYLDETQQRLAELSKQLLQQSKRFEQSIAVQILPATRFYPAETYHQGYYRKNAFAYKRYEMGSGRASFRNRYWSAPTIKPATLTPLQQQVALACGTEPAFRNAYWDNHEDGIYVDVVDGTPLFSSTDKYDSGSGWPSFTRPISDHVLEKVVDHSHGMERIEVKSFNALTHLGHVFDDGPRDQGGLRYCINSASLRFIPKDQIEKEGYGQYLPLFNQK